MADDTMFAEAVSAVKAGETARARDLLARLLRADSSNPDYWLWMSAVVESERESVYCLRSVTKLRPGHAAARMGLTVLGQISRAAEQTGPVRQQRTAPFPHQAAGRINSMAEWWKVRRNRENAMIAFLGFTAFALVLVLILTFVQFNIPDVNALLPAESTKPTAIAGTPSLTGKGATNSLPAYSLELTQTGTPSGKIPFSTYIGVAETPTAIYGVTPIGSSGAFEVALSTLQSGKLDDALKLFLQLATQQPKSAQIQYFLGEIYRQQHRMKDSFAAYTRATELDSNYALGYLGLAVWHRTDNWMYENIKELNIALKLDPKLVDAYIERAWYYSRREKWPEARNDLQKAVSIAPMNAYALMRLSRAQVHTGQQTEALVNIIKSQIIDPTILEGYLAMGEVFDSLGLHSLAIPPLNTYTVYAPDDRYGLILYCQVLTQAGKFDDAIAAGTKAVEMNNEFVPALMARGEAYRQKGDYGLAKEDFRVASEREPFNFDTQFNYGRSLTQARMLNTAIKVLSISAMPLAKTVQQKADATGWLALALEAFGDPKAREMWLSIMSMEGVPEYWWTTAVVHLYGQPTLVPTKAESSATDEPPIAVPTQTRTATAKP